MKRIAVLIVSLLIAIQSFGQQPKYVFLFIGDGMGTNQVHLTETYLSSIEGEYGFTPIRFTQFPVASIATTYCLNSLVTDSAAAGTAIATGVKTNVGKMGTDPDENPLTTVAEMAKRSGKKVAIMSTVGINHATPGAFYTHQSHRGMYDHILGDLPKSGFDFFAGSAILDGSKENRLYSSDEEREKVVTDGGYTLVRGREEFLAKYKDASRMIIIPDKEHSVELQITMNAMNEEERAKHLSLKDMVQSSVEFMMKDNWKKGFFLMAEGGSIDGQCHGNDAASAIQEVLGMDEAIEYAYQFYLKHPKETAIIVTADHETGGLTITGKKPQNFALLQYQNMPQKFVTTKLKALMKSQEEVVSWEQVKNLLGEYLGLWREIELTAEEEAVIRAEYDATVAKRETGHVVDPYAYADNAKIVATAVKVLDAKAGVNWVTGGHTAAYVPVYAIGPKTEIFMTKNDNTDICKKIVKIAGYK